VNLTLEDVHYIFNNLSVSLLYVIVVLMVKDIKELSLNSLLDKLHSLMVNLVKDVNSVIEDNQDMSMKSIRDIRDHINYKLGKKEEIYENEKILKMLNLLSEDKAVLEIIREDAEEWVNLLDAIEESIGGNGGTLTKKEEKEIKEINRLTTEIKSLIRKD
jgi:hypothetical protein